MNIVIPKNLTKQCYNIGKYQYYNTLWPRSEVILIEIVFILLGYVCLPYIHKYTHSIRQAHTH